ncbi:hypothetical protein [Sinomonas humi]|uniref:Uncharacterized protein n=1 Tax=Sinomonas humi TaxID=1338436 RepID=A0A0B2AHF2_9MICC|nr:hypothetical protein [Sinomonas humi]KHL02952.1 hypothetical protein LK10_11235 [Sinomonas humi]
MTEIDQQAALTVDQVELTHEAIVVLRSLFETYPVCPMTHELVEAQLEELEGEIERMDASSSRVSERLFKIEQQVIDGDIDVLASIVSAVIEQHLMALR